MANSGHAMVRCAQFIALPEMVFSGLIDDFMRGHA